MFPLINCYCWTSKKVISDKLDGISAQIYNDPKNGFKMYTRGEMTDEDYVFFNSNEDDNNQVSSYDDEDTVDTTAKPGNRPPLSSFNK